LLRQDIPLNSRNSRVSWEPWIPPVLNLWPKKSTCLQQNSWTWSDQQSVSNSSLFHIRQPNEYHQLTNTMYSEKLSSKKKHYSQIATKLRTCFQFDTSIARWVCTVSYLKC
jgi:hypothetical protein